VSKWLNGKTLPPLWVLAIVDRLCGQPLGYVLRLARLVEDDLDVRDRIATDPALDPGKREQLLGVYDIFRRDSSTELMAAANLATTPPATQGEPARPSPAELARQLADHDLESARPKPKKPGRADDKSG
jgi:hypothetical protein